MTSTVLARKYRPRSFEAMVGQGHVVQALANALTQQRLHHAYLFTGTRGVGKTTVSRILAKSLNCVGPDGQGGITAQPCGQCQPCRDIDAGRFVDYVELDAASNRGVEEISQLLDQAVYKPVVGRFKVYMIDEVHMLSNTAFNAMLKTLEEPPDYLKFVLATTDPQKVPVTVLSRCLQFNLRPMALQTVHEHLEQVLAAEGVRFEPGALRLLARAARGSMRDGLSLTDQAIAYGGGALEEAVVRQMLGSVDRQHVVRILQAVVDGDGAALVDAVDGLRRLGLSAQGTLDELAAALQHMALLQTVAGMADGDPETATWQALAERYAPDETQMFYSLALHGRQELPLAPDEYAGLLMILLRWLAFKPGSTLREGIRPKAEGPAAQAATGPLVSNTRPSHARPTAAPPASGPAVLATPSASVVAPTPVAPAPEPTPAPASARAPMPARAESPDPRPEPPPWDDEGSIGSALTPDMDRFDEVAVSASSAPAPVSAWVPAIASRAGTTDPAPAPARVHGLTATVVPVVPTTVLGDRWADVVARLQSEGLITALVRELAVQAECVAVQDEPGMTVWTLRVERESLRGDVQRDRLTQAVQKALGGEVRIELQAGVARDTPALRDQAARASRQAAAESLIKQDPLVNSLLEQYPGARVVPGSIAPL